MNKYILTLCLALTGFSAFAQEAKGKNYFIVKGRDTTHCQQLKYRTNAQGYLSGLEYTDEDGREVKIDGKRNVPDVETICVNNVIYDKIPLKANKPKSYIRYTERVVDGKLRVYLAQQRYVESETGTHAYGLYRFFIKMPDGTYYKINSNGNMKKHIKPYLLSCPEFKEGYKGSFSSAEEDFIKMINYYNSLCK